MPRNRKEQQFDTKISSRVKLTDIAQIANYFSTHGVKIKSLSSVFQQSISIFADILREQNHEIPIDTPQEALDILRRLDIAPDSEEFDKTFRRSLHLANVKISIQEAKDEQKQFEQTIDKDMLRLVENIHENKRISGKEILEKLSIVPLTKEELEEKELALERGKQMVEYQNRNIESDISDLDNPKRESSKIFPFRKTVSDHLDQPWVKVWYEKHKDSPDGIWYKETYLDKEKDIVRK